MIKKRTHLNFKTVEISLKDTGDKFHLYFFFQIIGIIFEEILKWSWEQRQGSKKLGCWKIANNKNQAS